MATKYQFLVIAANKLQGATFLEAVEVSVFSETEQGAVRLAKKLIPKRKMYVTRKVVETQEPKYPDYTKVFSELIKAVK